MNELWPKDLKAFSETKRIESKVAVPFVEKTFQGKTYLEKSQEIFDFAKELGLTPEQVLFRILNQDKIDLVRKQGTDRVGVDAITERKWKASADIYQPQIANLGLKNEDCIYAYSLAEWSLPLIPGGFFDAEILGIPPEKQCVVLYDADLLHSIEDNEPASSKRQLGELYYFREPQKKLGALRGILTQPTIVG